MLVARQRFFLIFSLAAFFTATTYHRSRFFIGKPQRHFSSLCVESFIKIAKKNEENRMFSDAVPLSDWNG